MEFEVEPCLEPKYCVVCWWYVKVEHIHRPLNYADILLNGVPICEEHLPMVLKEPTSPNFAVCRYFERRAKELEEKSGVKVECEPAFFRWNLRAHLIVTRKEEEETEEARD